VLLSEAEKAGNNRHVIRCHSTQRSRVQHVLWSDMEQAGPVWSNNTRHVIRCQLTQRTRAQHALDDVASNNRPA